jgi:adenylate kinase
VAAKFILFVGVQGSGKGTQAKVIEARYGLPQVSTGDLFRAMRAQDTPLARQIQEIMAAGHLVPDDITVQVVRERLARPDAAGGVVFDGFPRTGPQAAALDALLAEFGARVDLVVLFNLDRTEAVKRISARWQHPTISSDVYNLISKPPKVPGVSDLDGTPLIQRKDDTPEAANKRIDDFLNITKPQVVDGHYRPRGVVLDVDAGQPIDAVTEAVLAAMDKVTRAQ